MTASQDGLGAIYSELRAVATRVDRDAPGAGAALRDAAELALRAVLDGWRARTTTTTTTTSTTRRAGTPEPPYARRGAPARARGNHN